MTTRTLHVQVPATSANLGSGFDAVGIALNYFNEIYFTEDDKEFISVEIEGLGKGEIPETFADNMVGQAMERAAAYNGGSLPKGGAVKLVNRIPPGRGMGSSSSAIIGGILIGDALTGSKMSREDMLSLATEIEGHPDNVAPALLGGLTISIMDGGKTMTNVVPVGDDLSFITVSPDVEVFTEDARAVLPKEIAYKDAVFNVSRVSFLVSSLVTKQYDRLQYGLQDKLHVPYRIGLIPGGESVLKAAEDAGALGATISGSGSTLIAFAVENEQAIMEAMMNEFKIRGIDSEGHILKCWNKGAQILP